MDPGAPRLPASAPPPAIRPHELRRTVVLIGMMGAGKSTIGRRLAARLHVDFVDADIEIEAAAGCTIEEIFARHGEAAFRDGERRVIARLLDRPPQVLATGGGAFCDAQTRARIRQSAVSVWLRADVDLLLRRVSRRGNRPLLKTGDVRATLEGLVAARYPVYAEADITVDAVDAPPEVTVATVVSSLTEYLAACPHERREGGRFDSTQSACGNPS